MGQGGTEFDRKEGHTSAAAECDKSWKGWFEKSKSSIF